MTEQPEAMSLLGRPLYPLPLSPETRAKYEANLAEAQADYDKDPHNVDHIIWLGRREGYLWRYNKSIEIFTAGLQLYPDSYKLYRHRGHRYISIRKFDLAIQDLERASALIEGVPDEIEPDGIPNKLNQPTSTSHFNIWYHLGLAYYLTDQLERAAHAYRQCMTFSDNDDAICATTDWLYMTYRRLDDTAKADEVLQPIHNRMTIIENTAYYNRLLMYKGELSPDSLLDLNADNPEEKALNLATQGYGVGNWYYYNGQRDKALDIFQQVLDGDYWAAFGYIAAEVDVYRQRR